MTPRVSVVVPTYHRPHLLARCLAALASQTLPPWEYEIVVADDAALGATRRQVEAAVARYVPVTGGHGPAARGPIVAFTEDDTVPDPDWLAAGVAPFDRDPDLAAATGPRRRGRTVSSASVPAVSNPYMT